MRLESLSNLDQPDVCDAGKIADLLNHLRRNRRIHVQHGNRFAAHLRTDGITTDSGVRFAIFPRGTGEKAILTPNLIGTQPWALDETEFTTGPQTRLVEILLRRMPSQKFDNRIQGTVWVDDVSLTPAPPGPGRRSP